MSPETMSWDSSRKSLGAHGCVPVGTATGNSHERSHNQLWERHAALMGNGYMRPKKKHYNSKSYKGVR